MDGLKSDSALNCRIGTCCPSWTDYEPFDSKTVPNMNMQNIADTFQYTKRDIQACWRESKENDRFRQML